MCSTCEEHGSKPVDLHDTEHAKPFARALRSLFTKRDLFVSAVELDKRGSEILALMMMTCLSEDVACHDKNIKLETLNNCGHSSGCCRRFTFTGFQNAYVTITKANGDELLVDDYFIPASA
jgi:hypothetical protein